MNLKYNEFMKKKLLILPKFRRKCFELTRDIHKDLSTKPQSLVYFLGL